jgi:hypothetical protein
MRFYDMVLLLKEHHTFNNSHYICLLIDAASLCIFDFLFDAEGDLVVSLTNYAVLHSNQGWWTV